MAAKNRNKKPKQPKASVPTSREKRPKLPPSSPEEFIKHMSWRFTACDHEGPFAWGWHALETHLEKLKHFESQPWGQSEGTGVIGAKRIPLDSLSNEATKRLRRLQLDDVDALWELRLAGKPRFWGMRHGNCFHFLWWDPDHKVCPSTR